MSLTNVTLTSSLTHFTAIQPVQPFVLSSSISPLLPLHLAPVTQQPSASRRHGNRLGRRSLNMGDEQSPKVLVSAKGGAKRIAINDDGSVTATMTPNSVYSVLEVLLLCHVASDLNINFPHCPTRETASTEQTTENQSNLSFVLLFFRHSARYLCIDSQSRVYSLPKVGDYRSKVNECVFQHDVFTSNYDTYHSRQYSPGGARNGSEQQSPGGASRCNDADRTCHVGRWYLSVKGSKVTTRKTSEVRPLPPKSAQFIQLNIEAPSLKDKEHGPLKDFALTGPTSTPLPVTGSRQGEGPRKGKQGRGKGGRRRTTESPPFSVTPKRRGQTSKNGRKCGKNLLGKCSSKKTTTTRGEERTTQRTDRDSGGND